MMPPRRWPPSRHSSRRQARDPPAATDRRPTAGAVRGAEAPRRPRSPLPRSRRQRSPRRRRRHPQRLPLQHRQPAEPLARLPSARSQCLRAQRSPPRPRHHRCPTRLRIRRQQPIRPHLRRQQCPRQPGSPPPLQRNLPVSSSARRPCLPAATRLLRSHAAVRGGAERLSLRRLPPLRRLRRLLHQLLRPRPVQRQLPRPLRSTRPLHQLAPQSTQPLRRSRQLRRTRQRRQRRRLPPRRQTRCRSRPPRERPPRRTHRRRTQRPAQQLMSRHQPRRSPIPGTPSRRPDRRFPPGATDRRRRPGAGPSAACWRRSPCQDCFAFKVSTACGTTLNRSPTTPKSAMSKIGASASLFTATIVFEVCMPALCWIAPEMPRAT